MNSNLKVFRAPFVTAFFPAVDVAVSDSIASSSSQSDSSSNPIPESVSGWVVFSFVAEVSTGKVSLIFPSRLLVIL
jgi:hypothetical protein